MANTQEKENVAVEEMVVPAKKKPGRPKKAAPVTEAPVETSEVTAQPEEVKPVAGEEQVPVDLVEALGTAKPKIKVSFPTGKVPQKKKNVTFCNPKSKQYNKKIANSRKKEKARRQTNKKLRRMGKK